jgi:predicted nucleic acid-binding protein
VRFTERLERRIAEIVDVQPDDVMMPLCAELRSRCQQAGHALGERLHDGDRWIAATAIRLDVPLVSHDQLFNGAPGLRLITADAAR